jgi:hypothetical protein
MSLELAGGLAALNLEWTSRVGAHMVQVVREFWYGIGGKTRLCIALHRYVLDCVRVRVRVCVAWMDRAFVYIRRLPILTIVFRY